MANDQVASGLVEPQGLGEDPLFHFTRIFLAFAQGLFKNLPTGSFRWTDDEKLSEIAITDSVPIPRTRVEQKPQIVTMRGPAQFANLSLDQMRSIDPHTGKKQRTDLVSCTMTFNIIAKNGIEAQRIAWILMRHLRTFKGVLQRRGIHKVGDELSMSPESPPGSFVSEPDPEWVLISIFCPFFFQWTENDTSLSSPLLGEVEAHMQSSILPVSSNTTSARQQTYAALRTPTIKGRPITTISLDYERVGEITQTVKS